jgi:FAD/FMN-containing dehydrogenase
VDVSTSAQATLGGMAGNNSCGSRSIAYGNMVHNVAGAEAWLADGELVRFGPVDQASGRAARIAGFVRDLAERTAARSNALAARCCAAWAATTWTSSPRSEKPYTTDGSVNLAHLLVGAEGTLAFTKSLTLR